MDSDQPNLRHGAWATFVLRNAHLIPIPCAVVCGGSFWVSGYYGYVTPNDKAFITLDLRKRLAATNNNAEPELEQAKNAPALFTFPALPYWDELMARSPDAHRRVIEDLPPYHHAASCDFVVGAYAAALVSFTVQ